MHMPTHVQELLRDFVDFCTTGTDRQAVDLLVRCDRLVAAIHDVPDLFDEQDYPDPPARDYVLTYARVAAAMPGLGYYRSPRDVHDLTGVGEPMVQDAIDDITDIVGDFQEVLWRHTHTSTADATWHLRQSYRDHWGHHMRSLQVYLAFCEGVGKETLDVRD